MNAVEFVKKFGWDGAISFTDWYGGNTAFKFLKVKEKTISVHSGDQPYDFHINDLKRLVESYELVESVGGWNNATALYDEYLDKDLGRAIEDVRKCQ